MIMAMGCALIFAELAVSALWFSFPSLGLIEYVSRIVVCTAAVIFGIGLVSAQQNAGGNRQGSVGKRAKILAAIGVVCGLLMLLGDIFGWFVRARFAISASSFEEVAAKVVWRRESSGAWPKWIGYYWVHRCELSTTTTGEPLVYFDLTPTDLLGVIRIVYAPNTESKGDLNLRKGWCILRFDP